MTKLIVADAGANRAPGGGESSPGARRTAGFGRLMRPIRAVLLDIDGVPTVSWRPVPGAIKARARLRADGYAVALVTNTTSRDRPWMTATLTRAGFGVDAAEIFTAPAITVLGGAGPDFSCAALNRVFGYLPEGARLVAMGRNPAFFATAPASLGADPSQAVMVGDDIEADVLGAQRHGLTGVLVRTGKCRPESLRDAPGAPDHVIGSIADLPALLERLGPL